MMTLMLYYNICNRRLLMLSAKLLFDDTDDIRAGILVYCVELLISRSPVIRV
jgi:hypothetical protein